MADSNNEYQPSDSITGKQIDVDSEFGREIGFNSDKFESISYIIKDGDDLIFSAIFDKLSKSKKEKIVKKILNSNFEFTLPMINFIKLLSDVERNGYNCVVPEFYYYDKALKSLGFIKEYAYDDLYGGYIVLWSKGNPILDKVPPNLEAHKKAMVNRNLQTLAYLAEHLGLKRMFYNVDCALCEFNNIDIYDLQFLDTLGLPEYLIQIRLTQLLKMKIINQDKRLKRFTFSSTKEAEKFKQNIIENFIDPSEYCRWQFALILSKFQYSFQK